MSFSKFYPIKDNNFSLQCIFYHVDCPLKPEGPLEITDIHKEGCHLKWDPPKDDGGLPIDQYVVEKMDVTTGQLQL